MPLSKAAHPLGTVPKAMPHQLQLRQRLTNLAAHLAC
jgi:hypothetical protein